MHTSTFDGSAALSQQHLLDQAIVLALGCAFLVDMLNGLSEQLGYGLPISLIFKVLLLALIFVRLSLTHLRACVLLVALLSVMVLPSVLVATETSRPEYFLADLGYAVRIVLVLSALAYLAYADFARRYWRTAFALLCFAFVVNMTAGLLGLGDTTYRDDAGFGVKGWIYAGNELGNAYLCISYGLLFGSLRLSGAKLIGAASILVVAFGALIGTKVAILGGLLLVVARIHKLGLRMLLSVVIASLAVLGTLVVIFNDLLASVATVVLGRFMHFYEQGGVGALLFSGRDEFVTDTLSYVLQSGGPLNWIFGWRLGFLFGHVKPFVEIDLVDLIVWFGVIGAVCAALFFLLILDVVSRGGASEKPYGYLFALILLGISALAGHLLYSGVVVAPLVLALGLVHKKQLL